MYSPDDAFDAAAAVNMLYWRLPVTVSQAMQAAAVCSAGPVWAALHEALDLMMSGAADDDA